MTLLHLTAQKTMEPVMAFFYRYSQLISLAVLIILNCIVLPTQANDEENIEQLYQVEVIVFTPLNRPKITESWKQVNSVEWPSPLIFLKQNSEEPSGHPPENHDNAIDKEQADDATNEEIKTLHALSRDQFILFDTESYLHRQGYRVLSHQSWLQNISDKKTAPHIVIYGGKKYADHQSLEGSIQVYVERYLHVDTDLWLIDFSPNVGQDSKTIPYLPPRPFNPNDFLNLASDDEQSQPFQWDTDNQESFNTLNIGKFQKDSSASKRIRLGQKPVEIFDAYLSEAQWLPNQIIPLRQHRKMKSGELHYIDHPLFGVLIQVNRYENPSINTETSSEE